MKKLEKTVEEQERTISAVNQFMNREAAKDVFDQDEQCKVAERLQSVLLLPRFTLAVLSVGDLKILSEMDSKKLARVVGLPEDTTKTLQERAEEEWTEMSLKKDVLHFMAMLHEKKSTPEEETALQKAKPGSPEKKRQPPPNSKSSKKRKK